MSQKSALPLRTTLGAVLVLITSAWNLARLLTSLSWQTALEAYAPKPGALYIGLSGAVWAAIGISVLVGYWRRSPWAPMALLCAAGLYAAWFWADRLLAQAQAASNWPFDLAVTIVLLGFVTTVALDRRNPRYFGKEAHERE